MPQDPAHILVVDDEKEFAETCATILRDQGYDVLTAYNPDKALQTIRETARPFDLVITDLNMPGDHGDGLAQRIKHAFPDTKIILCSADIHEAIVHTTYSEYGISAALPKPFPLARLIEIVRSTLAGTSTSGAASFGVTEE